MASPWSARAIRTSSSVLGSAARWSSASVDGEHFLASDPIALAGKTEKVVFLQDHQLAF